MPGKHAQWSPSGSPYWYNHGEGCPARAMLPPKPETSSPAGEEGTRLHQVSEDYLLDGVQPTPEDWEKIGAYCEYVESKGLTHTVTIEVAAQLESVTGEKGATGMVDALAMSDTDLEVIDLKSGAKRVDPDTPQLRIYAAGIAEEEDYTGETITCTIHQGGEARSITYPTEEVVKFATDVREYVANAVEHLRNTGEPRYNPSENNCQWCPHVVDCKAIKEFRNSLAAEEFAVSDDPVELGSDLGMVGALRRWCDEIERRALQTAEKGTAIPGYKLVRARTNRRWGPNAEKELVALLGDAAYDSKLIGLTAAGKLVDKTTIDELTIKPEGKPTLAPEDDKRPAIDDAATDFKDA